MQDGVRVENLEKVQEMLSNLAEHIDDIRPALHEAGQIIQNSTEEAFESGVSPWGETWTPLSPVTLDKKKITAFNPISMGKLLYDTGRMRESVYMALGIDGKSVEVGLNAKSKGYPYPAVHQFGTDDGKIPARPFLPMDSDGELERRVSEEILEVFEAHLELGKK